MKTPLNYTGNKSRLVNEFKDRFPKEIDLFVDLFCGGGTVGLSVDAKRVVLCPSCHGLVHKAADRERKPFLRKLLNDRKEKSTTREYVVQLFMDLRNLFVGEILHNPDHGDYIINDYKAFCYARCSRYQEEIAKQKKMIEECLAKNDGSFSDEQVQSVRDFLKEVGKGAKEAAETFYSILGKGDGKDEEYKNKLNHECYDFSLEARN